MEKVDINTWLSTIILGESVSRQKYKRATADVLFETVTEKSHFEFGVYDGPVALIKYVTVIVYWCIIFLQKEDS